MDYIGCKERKGRDNCKKGCIKKKLYSNTWIYRIKKAYSDFIPDNFQKDNMNKENKKG